MHRTFAALVVLAILAVLAGAAARPGLGLGAAPLPAARAAQVAPASQRAFDEARRWLPALNHLHDADVCDSWVNVQNLGAESTQVLLVAFGAAAACEPCSGSVETTCSGMIAPGRTWAFFGAQIPIGTSSAVLLGASTRPLSAVDPSAGSSEPVGSWLCQRVYDALTLNCAGYAELASGWRPGGTVFGLPADAIVGGALAATVLRGCPASLTPGRQASSAYDGPADADLGAPREGAWHLVAPAVHRDDAEGQASTIVLQNAGHECAEAVVELVADGACAPTAVCDVPTIAPGAAVAVPLARCAPEGFHGGALVRASQPLAVVVDTVLGDGLTAYAAAAAAARPADAPGALASLDRRRAGAPYMAGGPSTDVAVRLALPAGGAAAARWRVTARDASGAVRAERTVEACAGGVAVASFPAGTLDGPASLAVEPEGEPGGDALGVVEERRLDAVGTGEVVEASARSLSHPPDAGGAAAVVALPLAVGDLAGSGISGQLVVFNRSVAAGEVEAAAAFHDANGLVDTVCAVLGPGAMARFDLAASPPPVAAEFVGSAVVRATGWTHAGPPALDAAFVVRVGAAAGQDVPGDELGAAGSIRLTSAAAERLGEWGVEDPCADGGGPPRPPALPGGPPPPEARRVGPVLALPVLGNLGQDDLCAIRLTVRNHGDEPSTVLLIAFDDPGFCAPGCFGPRRVACVRDVPPGEARTVDDVDPSIDGRPFSALAVSVSTRRLSELGIVLPGIEGDPPLADVVCERASEIAGSCLGFGELRAAMLREGAWQGIPVDRALGPAIGIDADRACEYALDHPPAQAPYAALAENGLVAPFGGGEYGYGVPLAHGRAPIDDPVLGPGAEASTTLYVQNVGDACTSVRIQLRATGACAATLGCWVATLAPGDTYPFDLTDCTWRLGAWSGSVELRGSQPLAIVAEHRIDGPDGAARLRAFPARPGFEAFDVDGDGTVGEADAARVQAALGSAEGEPGWDDRDDLDGDGAVTEADVALVLRHVCADAAPSPVFVPFAEKPRR